MHTPASRQLVLIVPRGPLDILKKVLGMHAQVVTKPSLATTLSEPESYDDTIFRETLEDCSFQKMNILPSTRHGNVLDLILTNFTEHFQIQTDYEDEFRTDHRILKFKLPIASKLKRLCTTRCIYK